MGCLCLRKEESAEDTETESAFLPDILSVLPFTFKATSVKSTTYQSEYNDTLLEHNIGVTPPRGILKQTSWMDSQREFSWMSRQPTFTYTSSLAQVVQFKLGNELICMSWNMSHKSQNTPFDYYCDYRTMGVNDVDSAVADILWDVSRVFFMLNDPWELPRKTFLNQVVPSHLLSENVLKAYCTSSKIEHPKWMETKNFANNSVHEFMTTISCLDKVSLEKMHLRSFLRATNPLRQNYDPQAYIQMIAQKPTLLPLLILDSLHLMIIKFTFYLLGSNIKRAFSEYEDENQIETFNRFLNNIAVNNLTVPKLFEDSKVRLYEKWNSVFQESNKMRQILQKVERANADIVFLQKVSEYVFTELKSALASQYSIFPTEYPSEVMETTMICLLNDTVQSVEPRKEKRVDSLNFALLCTSSKIKYYVGVVCLPGGEDRGQARRRPAIKLTKMLGGNTAAIIGGEFNEDLTTFDNPVTKYMLKTYNGIDHTQKAPLAWTINPTRSYLQFNMALADRQEESVSNGIFSSFPLVGEAFTDFTYSGLENPSSNGAIFQKINLSVL